MSQNLAKFTLAALLLLAVVLVYDAPAINSASYRFSFSFPFSNTNNETTSATLTKDASTIVSGAAASVVYVNGYKNMPEYRLQYRKVGNYLQLIEVPSGVSSIQEVTSGSGFFITADGYILTNKHVVADQTMTYKVNYDGKTDVDADVVYRDPNTDLAIVKINGSGFPVLGLGDSSNLKLGEDVVAVGNPYGEYTDYGTQGFITGMSKSLKLSGLEGNEKLTGMVQSTTKLYPGDSGGPLLNLQNQVVAVNTATSVGHRISVSYSIPINTAKNAIANAGIEI